MNNIKNLVLLILSFGLFACNGSRENGTDSSKSITDSISDTISAVRVDSIPKYAQKIIDAYPDLICGLKMGIWYLQMALK